MTTRQATDVTLLRDAAVRLRQTKHANGFGTGLSSLLAKLLEAEADSLDEIAAEVADRDAAGELIIVMTTTAAAVDVAQHILAG